MKYLEKYWYWFVLAFILFGGFTLKSQKDTVVSMSVDDNIKAFLMMLRKCEGTSDDKGYSRLFGGKQFADFSKHPNVRVPFRNTYSTAAGAYQFLYSTWMEKKLKLGLPDFSPKSQDLAAIDILRQKGALPFIQKGDIVTAIDKVKKVWASLPNAGYNQPEKSLNNCIVYYKSFGGQIMS